MTLTRGAPDDALTAPADRRPAASPAAGPAGSVGSVGASTVDRVVRVLLALAVVWYLGTGLWQAAHDAPTVDEAVDVSSGVATLVHHDLRMNPEHAPLPKVLSVLPALLARPVVPEGASWQDGDWFGFTDDFVRANRDAGRLDTVLFLARLVPLAEGLGCAWLIHLLARRFFGRHRRRGCRRLRAAGHRHRHGRLHPGAIERERYRWLETHPRPRQPRWDHPARPVA